jgi:cell division protein FtsN
MTEETNTKSGFWNSLGGTITKITGLVAALAGLVTVLSESGLFDREPVPDLSKVKVEVRKPEQPDRPPLHKLAQVCGSEEPCFVICESAFGSKEQAQQRLAVLGHMGYNSRAAYLWIPDFDCLSGAQSYLVYIGPFKRRDAAEAALCKYNQNTGKTGYGLKIHPGTARDEFRCP